MTYRVVEKIVTELDTVRDIYDRGGHGGAGYLRFDFSGTMVGDDTLSSLSLSTVWNDQTEW